MTHSQFTSQGWQKVFGDSQTTTVAAPSSVSVTRPSGLVITEGYRGCRLRFIFSTSTATAGIGVYAVDTEGGSPAEPVSYFSELMLSTGNTDIAAATAVPAGVAGGFVPEGWFYAVTSVAPTISAFGTHMLNYIGGATSNHTVAGDTVAELAISDVGNVHGLAFSVPAISAGSFNILIKLDV